MSRSSIIWCISDGKAGHVNQMRGLVRAVGQRGRVQSYWLQAPGWRQSIIDVLRGRFPAGADLPDPWLILCAGHATHLPALAARHARGGRVVVLMNPSLPLCWFDLCLVPEHDGVEPAPNVLVTRGALNAVKSSSSQADEQGLILIGGASSHHAWSDEVVTAQLETITEREPHLHWQLLTSRRTPDSLIPRLEQWRAENVTIVPFVESMPNLVPRHLASASQVWVTEDSVSMIYEALTSGSAVGLLKVPRRRYGRVVRGITRLIDEGCVTPFDAWQAGEVLMQSTAVFNEAERCADLICLRLPEIGRHTPRRPVAQPLVSQWVVE